MIELAILVFVVALVVWLIKPWSWGG